MDLTVRDAARLLATSEKTVYRWIHDGTLPCYRVSDHYRLNRVELLEWASQRQMNVAPDIFEDEQELPGQLLTDAIRRGGVVYELAGDDKRSVLSAVCAALPLPPSANREELQNVLLAREQLASTAIGNGIAIPHPRSPIVVGVTQPLVTIAFLQKPVDFGALDGRPVHTLFVTLSTTVRLHLQILSHLMFVLQDAPFRGMLRERGAAEMVIKQVETLEAQIARAAEGSR